MPSLQEKTCTKCLQSKELTKFRNDKHSKDGKTSRCRSCLKQDGKTSYPTQRNKKLLRAKQERLENPERLRQRDRDYYANNPEKMYAKYAAYYAANKEKECARAAKYKEEHQEWYRDWNINYRLTHKDEHREYARNYRAEHPEKHRARIKRRKARIKNAPVNDFTDTQWAEEVAAAHGRCDYCEPDCEECRKRTHIFTQEHVTSYHDNGSHTLWNIKPICQSCNSKKGKSSKPPRPTQMSLLTTAPAKPLKKKDT